MRDDFKLFSRIGDLENALSETNRFITKNFVH